LLAVRVVVVCLLLLR
jgi:hypothetical protein